MLSDWELKVNAFIESIKKSNNQETVMKSKRKIKAEIIKSIINLGEAVTAEDESIDMIGVY